MNKGLLLGFICLFLVAACDSPSKPSGESVAEINYPSYEDLVMCGYQGWFRAEGDGSGMGWVHYGARNNKFDPENITIDLWPDVTEYAKTYPTEFIHADSSTARVFSPVDASTVDLHFQWMKEYGIDGVFMQRFYAQLKNEKLMPSVNQILANAFAASKKHDRAIAIMYDLSGLDPEQGEDMDLIKEDWKSLVKSLDLRSPEVQENYLHHNGKPLMTIWGIGTKTRAYDIRNIKLEEFLDFVKNDPEYGGFSVMIGVPTYFRTLTRDTRPDPYLHEIIRKVDIVQPWMVGRFHMKDVESEGYREHLAQDLAWCTEQGVDYVPTVYPGFSWYNYSRRTSRHEPAPLNQIPRLKGKFLQTQLDAALSVGCKMVYVAMFDEIDEGTAIFKCTNNPPVNGTFSDYEGLPTDHYLKMLGAFSEKMKERKN